MRFSGIGRSVRVAAVMGIAVVAFALASCGGGGGGVANVTALAAEQALAKVGETSAATESASFAFEISGTGDFAFQASGTGKYTTSPEYAAEMSFSDFSAVGQAFPGGLDVRIIGTVTYMRMPALAEIVGAEWITFDLSTMDDVTGLDLGSLTQQQHLADPRAQVAVLVNSGDVTQVGEEEVDGVDTVHYQGTVDPARLAELHGVDADIQESMRAMYEDLGISSISYDLWVDNDFQPRKIAAAMQADRGTVNSTMTLTDFGKPVTVEAPPDALDFSSLLDSGVGG